MSMIGDITTAVEKSWGWLSTRSAALFYRRETHERKRLENQGIKVAVRDAAKLSAQQHIDWKIEKYKNLGLSDEEIRKRVLHEIESPLEPLDLSENPRHALDQPEQQRRLH